MLTVIVSFVGSGNSSTLSPFARRYSVIPSTEVTRSTPLGSAGAAAACGAVAVAVCVAGAVATACGAAPAASASAAKTPQQAIFRLKPEATRTVLKLNPEATTVLKKRPVFDILPLLFQCARGLSPSLGPQAL